MTRTRSNSYLICTTPRSGSTLLCELLTATDIAGRPDEYFQQLRATGRPMTPRDYLAGVAADIVPPDDHEGELEEHTRFDPRRFPSFAEYLTWVRQTATTPNGVFGAKIMWPYVAGLVDGLATVDAYAGEMPTPERLEIAFPGLEYVWLRRMDKVRQAVSLWRAIQTWNWRRDAAARDEALEDASRPHLRYSFAAIDHLRRLLVASDRAWETYFEATGIRPLELRYEDFTHDLHGTVTRILGHVGMRCPAGARYDVPCTARQADEISERWVRDFRADFTGVAAVT
jgi:LPS sulfotransferase NodH